MMSLLTIMTTSVQMKKQDMAASFLPWEKSVFLVLALAKLWLVGGQTLYAIGYNMHDEGLFLNIANALLNGHWLGHNYNNLTLAKGPFYPVFIAITFILGIPLLVAQHLLYIIACILLCVALRPLLRPTKILAIYTFILFNPMSYTNEVTTRVLREGIYPSLTLLIVACAIGLLVRHDRSLKSLSLWSVGLGVTLSAFWLTREEGVWIIPSVFIIIGSAVVRVWQAYRFDVRRLTILCVLPVGIWMIATGAVAGINKARYGVFATVEFKSSAFLDAYGALSRVKHAHFRQYVPVPKETRERLYAVSPTFAELRPYLEGELGRGWSSPGCNALSICDDIAGGWFMWALRDAVAGAGYYTTGASAAKYYRRLADEINTACADRKLDCLAQRSSMMAPWNEAYTRPFLNGLLNTAIFLAQFQNFSAHSSPSEGTDDSLRLFRDLTGERLSPPGIKRLYFSGWAFSPVSELSLSVHTADGALADATMKHLASRDVYQYFLSTGRDIPNAREARFEVTTSCVERCLLYVKSGELIQQIPLDGSAKHLNGPEVFLNLESLDYGSEVTPGEDRMTVMNKIKCDILSSIGHAYQTVMPILIGLALLVFILKGMIILGTRSVTIFWMISAALLIAIITRVIILAIIDVTSFPGINVLYLSPAYALMLLFAALVLFDGKARGFSEKRMR